MARCSDRPTAAARPSPRAGRVSRRRLLAASGVTLGGLALSAGGAPAGGASAQTAAQPAAQPAPPQGPVQFPDGFLWGTASSAEQVEGAIHQDGRGPSIWDVFSHTPGRTYNGDTGDVACDEYNRYEQTFDLMAALGFTTYRFSISWSRILPSGRGPINQAGLNHYQRVVDALLTRGISPLITIYHWDLPQALEEAGGWTIRDTSARYAEYAAIVYDALADRVPHFLCLNEPSSQAWLGYGLGAIAPGRTGVLSALQSTHYQLLGQGLAVQAMRARNRPSAKIGTTLDLWAVQPASDSAADRAAATLFDGQWNRFYLDPIFKGAYPADMLAVYGRAVDLSFITPEDLRIIASPLDFFGLNYYTSLVIAADPQSPVGYRVVQPPAPQFTFTPTGFNPPTQGVTAMGWQVAPEGMTAVLLRVRDEYTTIPIVITETGAAYDDYVNPAGEVKDPERIAFLDAYLRAVHAAIAQGVDVRGLIVWCFQDNFASSNGYVKKFGLVWTDFVTQRLTPKQSARRYGQVIARNGLA